MYYHTVYDIIILLWYFHLTEMQFSPVVPSKNSSDQDFFRLFSGPEGRGPPLTP